LHYANRKYLVTANEVEEDGILYLIDGKIKVLKGNMILHNELGEVSVMPKDFFERNYIGVQKVKKKVDIDQMVANYAQDWSMMEEEDYIERFQENVRKRNELDNNN
jgi:hypothetical protein